MFTKPICHIMKLLNKILKLTLIIAIFSCNDDSKETDISEPSYYLKGLIGNLNEINFEYFEKEDAFRFASTDHNPGFERNDYYIEEIEMIFGMDPVSLQDIEISYCFKFDKDEYPWYNLSYFENIDELKEKMLDDEWGFGDSYLKKEKYIDISYSSGSFLGKSQLFYSYDPTDSTKNSVSNFSIQSIEEYEDWRNGEGLRVVGSFDAILYDRDDPSDSIALDNMDFKGFLTLKYCGKNQCQ